MAAQANQGTETKKRFSLFSYIRETKQELKRVSWPTKKELLKNTGVVLTVVTSATILVWALDTGYFIGKEAAGQIISYVQKHSAETKSSTSLPTISGTVTEIGNGYIMVDDTVLCKKSKAGKKYKVYTDDIKIRRWIESGELKEGDLVIVEYEGEISSNYEVKGAYSIFTGTLEENGILNQE